MKNGFLIVNYNDAETTLKLLENIKDYKCLDIIVVVDNGSTDHSYPTLKKVENQKIVILKNPQNKGYAAGINYGAKYLIDLYGIQNIVVSNADIIIRNERDLEKLFHVLNKKRDVAVASPVVLEHATKNRGWKIPTPMRDVLLNLPYIHRKLKGKILFYKEEHYKQKITDVEVVSGCFFVIKAYALKKIYYLDEETFLYYEENIMGYKLRNIKMRSVIVNNVNVIHNHSVTIDKSVSALKKYQLLKQSQYYFHKVYSKANFLERSCLKLTKNFTYLCLKIVYKIKDKKNEVRNGNK